MLKRRKRNSKSPVSQREFDTAVALSILREEYRHLLQSSRYQHELRLNRYGYCSYSQADEDGIIAEIFRRVGETNRVFVEFGCGSGLENNSHYLLIKGWSGLWIDGNQESIASVAAKFRDAIDAGKLIAENALITRENINALIGNHLQGEIDLLSVDIDGNDFHVLHALTCIQPRVVLVEYNARKGPSVDWVMQYNPAHTYDGTDYYGASLKAFERLMKRKGFLLVGCSISGVNAFFVREDLVDARRFLSPFTSEEHFEPQRKLLRLGIHTANQRNYGPWSSAEQLLGNASTSS